MNGWRKINDRRWERSDGAVVKYDNVTACNTSKPWLPGHRGYIAFGPGKAEHNYLGFKRRNSGMTIPRKFKSPESAMEAVDRFHPAL